MSGAQAAIEGSLELGHSLSAAVSAALGTTLLEFANAKGFAPEEVTMCLRRYNGRTYPAIRDALAETLGLERGWLDTIIDAQEPADARR